MMRLFFLIIFMGICRHSTAQFSGGAHDGHHRATYKQPFSVQLLYIQVAPMMAIITLRLKIPLQYTRAATKMGITGQVLKTLFPYTAVVLRMGIVYYPIY
jgi:hypothetical protein